MFPESAQTAEKLTLLKLRFKSDLNSESSMFIYPHKIILKTCGTTTLLIAIHRLLEIASEYCQLNKVWRVFYSRKSFVFPEAQLGPHKDWNEEVKFLDQLLGKFIDISRLQ